MKNEKLLLFFLLLLAAMLKRFQGLHFNYFFSIMKLNDEDICQVKREKTERNNIKKVEHETRRLF